MWAPIGRTFSSSSTTTTTSLITWCLEPALYDWNYQSHVNLLCTYNHMSAAAAVAAL